MWIEAEKVNVVGLRVTCRFQTSGGARFGVESASCCVIRSRETHKPKVEIGSSQYYLQQQSQSSLNMGNQWI